MTPLFLTDLYFIYSETNFALYISYFEIMSDFHKSHRQILSLLSIYSILTTCYSLLQVYF